MRLWRWIQTYYHEATWWQKNLAWVLPNKTIIIRHALRPKDGQRAIPLKEKQKKDPKELYPKEYNELYLNRAFVMHNGLTIDGK